ncbi:GntR family transcriptional regulator [Clostridium oceanicum]|uniref:GntR family transcriptional regulator n=1 Tax=Clostridium oceanicum TaxID=1543 RepID=A0ABP3V757_9CLOT
MRTIDKTSRVPLYLQLMDIIIYKIENTMEKGDKLLSEREICDKYDVSRSTVRQAISELERDGYIYKMHGKGTFVADKEVHQDLVQFYSFTDEMKKLGKTPTSKILDFHIIKATSSLSKKMEIMEGEPLYQLKRLRLADKVPMMLETTYIPYNRFKGVSEEKLERKPLYEILREEYDLKIDMAEEFFRPILTNYDESEILRIKEGSPSLKIARYTYEKNKIIEYTISIARGDKFKYRVKLDNTN